MKNQVGVHQVGVLKSKSISGRDPEILAKNKAMFCSSFEGQLK